MIIDRALCTATLQEIAGANFIEHKKKEAIHQNYGILWPTNFEGIDTSWGIDIPIVEEPVLAKHLGVSQVWIRYEGANVTGSMKDYLVRAVLGNGGRDASAFTVVSSGNHAVSLAHFAKEEQKKCVIFVPASTSKLSLLQKFENVLVIAVRDAIFEDVYRLAQRIKIDSLYNANVSNDFLMTQVVSASKQIFDKLSDNLPTHILAGVGNGSYLSGMIFGFDYLGVQNVRAVPVGMHGAFPTEDAFTRNVNLFEYEDFLYGEENIVAAEGSIACASYSMPQLMHATRKSNGFPLGGLTNADITNAYTVLVEKTKSFEFGHIPEPTGILSLAAALTHLQSFSPHDKLLLSFTGAGYKDISGIRKYGGTYSRILTSKILETLPPSFRKKIKGTNSGRVYYAEKNTPIADIEENIQTFLK